MKNIVLPDMRQMNMRTFFANQRNEIILTACVALVFSLFYGKIISPESVLAIVGAAILCPLFFKPPEYAVFLLVLFLPFRDIHLISIIQLKRLLIWILFSRLCIRQMIKVSPAFSSRSLRHFNIAALLFCIALALSGAQTVNQLFLHPDSLKRIVFSHILALIEQLLLIHIIYYSVTTRRQIRTLLNIIIAVSGFVAVLGIIQYYHGGRPGLLAFLYRPNYRFYGRATSVFSNPNGFGIFLAPLIAIIAVSFASHTNSIRKRLGFFLPILIVDCWAVFLTFSRTAMVQILFSVVIVGYLYYIKINQKRLTRKVIVILLLGIGLMIGAVHYYEQFAYLRKGAKNLQYPAEALEQIKNVSDAGRKHAARVAFETFLEHPLLGIGYGLIAEQRIGGIVWVENVYLKLLAETGIIGFLPFIILLYIIIKTGLNFWNRASAVHIPKETQMTMLLLLTAVTASLFGYLFVDSLSYIANTGYLWCLVGLIFVIERLTDREIHERRNLSELPPEGRSV